MTDDGLPRVYFDTTIFIEAFEGSSANSEGLKRIFNAFSRRPKLAVTSDFVLAELFGKEARHGWVWQNRFYLNLIVFSEAFDLRPLSRDILVETGAFRKAAKEQGRIVKLGDAIHAVTAAHADCRFFFTCDKRFLVPDPLVCVAPDNLGLETIIAALDA